MTIYNHKNEMRQKKHNKIAYTSAYTKCQNKGVSATVTTQSIHEKSTCIRPASASSPMSSISSGTQD